MNQNEAAKTRVLKGRSPTRALVLSLLFALVLSGCVNSRLGSLANQLNSALKNGAPNPNASGSPTSASGDFFSIATVNIAPPAGGGGGAGAAAPITSIYFDQSKSNSAIANSGPPAINLHCAAAGAAGAQNAKPCLCNFTWSESNTTTGNSLPFQRTVQTAVTNAQQTIVTCAAPDVFNTEVADGTVLKITVLAGPSSSEIFSTSQYNYIKNAVQSAGSFRDSVGHSFDNILHYACYEQFKRGSVIQSSLGTGNNAKTGEILQFPLANKFCLQSAVAGAPSPACPNVPAIPNNSTQAYYYNFFVRSGESGELNGWNDRYTCPTVKEPIYNSVGVGAQGNLYPMDATYALSIGKTPDFNIGVDAFTELSGGQDPNSLTSKSCAGVVGPNNGKTDSFVQGCLGFAARPNPDGTCPYFRDSNGAIRFTFRLRRFIALYPPLFGVDGKAPTNPQSTDQIYVLDRPVGVPPGGDPLKPYTMRGPKPCPFAIFDSNGVLGITDPLYNTSPNTGNRPTYGATNNPSWNGTNVDGSEFPNFDSPNSCATSIALVKSDPFNPDAATFTLATLNSKNPIFKRLFIRPIHAWAPHYEEDLDFQACAPQASPLRDPPLHFAKDPTTGNVSWCSESYPSQNDHVTALDARTDPNKPLSATNPYIGNVRPFTSHVAKHTASADCTPTIPSTIPVSPVPATPLYPLASSTNPASCMTATSTSGAGVARHPSDLLVDIRNAYTGAVGPSLSRSPQNVCSNQTCDRTALATGGLSWQTFPLLASAPAVETAIASDSTFGCVMTFDGGGPKTGKATPKEGCCGQNVAVYSGVNTTLALGNPGPIAGTPATSVSPGTINTTAHLEPDAPCLIPKY